MNHKNEQPRKLFIGGLSPETTDEDLKSYFSTFGNIEDVVVIKDRITKISRRFGFVVFSTMEEIDNAQKAKPHTINGRNVDTRRSCPKNKMAERGSIDHIRRLFVYGINDKTTQQSLEDYFNPYGNVKSIDIIKDKAGALRGFAFVEYDDSDPVDKLSGMEHHRVNGVDLQVKKALPKEQQQGGMSGDRTPYSRGAPRNSYNDYRPNGREEYNDSYRQDPYAARGPYQDNYSGYDNNTGYAPGPDQYRYAQRYDEPAPNYRPDRYNYDAGY